MSYACLFFDDVECKATTSRFKASGVGCWCNKAETRKSEDELKPLTIKEVIFLGFK